MKKQKKFENLKEYIKKFYGPAGTIIITEPYDYTKLFIQIKLID